MYCLKKKRQDNQHGFFLSESKKCSQHPLEVIKRVISNKDNLESVIIIWARTTKTVIDVEQEIRIRNAQITNR